jgi:gas vesicle protein
MLIAVALTAFLGGMMVGGVLAFIAMVILSDSLGERVRPERSDQSEPIPNWAQGLAQAGGEMHSAQ